MIVRARWAVTTALVVIAAATPAPAAGQSFGIRLERGEIGVDGRGRHQSREMATASTSSTLQQWLRLPASGFLVHPSVLRYTLAVRPLFGQHDATTLEQGTRNQSLGFDMSASLFPSRRVGLAIQATESSGESRGDFGSLNVFDNSDLTTVLFLRHRYFPTTVTYSDRSSRDTWESAYVTAPVLRDQKSSRLRAEVRNRKLTTIVEQRSYRDLRGTSDHDAFSAQARHRTEWGKGSSLVSLVNYLDRQGTSEIARTSWSERLVLQHTRAVSTSWSFARQTWSRSELSGRNLNYDGTGRYSPSLDFNTSVSVTGQSFQSGISGGLSRLRVAPSARYLLRLPRNARLSTSASVGAERLSRSLPSDVPLDVIEESHKIDDTRVFFLEQLRVEPGTIEVWDEGRTLLLQPEIDYRVVETGPTLEIHILPGSRVQVGEIVLVNYRYRSLAVENVGLLFVNYQTVLRVGLLSLRHGRRQRSEESSGPGGALEDPNDVVLWFGVGFSRQTRVGALSLEATHRSRSAAEIEYSSEELHANLTLPTVRAVQSRLRAATTRTVADGLNTRTTSGGATMSWRASRKLRLSAGLDGWLWQRDQQSPESFLAVNAMAVWTLGQVNAVVTLDQARRANGLSQTENRWSVRVIRRF